MSEADILKFGIILETTPPAFSLLSNIVASIPFFAKKYAADNPAGPEPMIPTFLPVGA